MTTTLLRLEPTMTVTPLPAGTASIAFPRDPKHVADARMWTVGTLVMWGIPDLVIDTAELLVSEAVTNAIKVCGNGPTTITAALTDGTVRISITDPDPAVPDVANLIDLADDNAESGRGLLLVDALADAYGFKPADDGGKALWFEIGGI